MRRFLALAGALVALGAVVAPSAHADGPHTGAPKVGACYDLTYRQLAPVSNTHPAVPCSQRHTLLVVAVPTLPRRVSLDGSDAYAEAAEEACTRPWAKAVTGGDFLQLARTAYSFAFFAPTKSEQKAGAHWVSCEVELIAANRLVPLRGTAPFVTGHLTDAVTRCDTAQFAATTCTRRHAYREAGLVELHQGPPPSHQEYQRLADQTCPRVAGSQDFAWSAPSPGSYLAGDRVLVCMRPTTS